MRSKSIKIFSGNSATTTDMPVLARYRLPWWGFGLIVGSFLGLLILVGDAWSESENEPAVASETTEVAAASTAPTSGDSALDLDALSAEQKRDLLRRKQQFDQLTASEQEKLRQLHQNLSAEPEAPQLTAVMTRYHQWLLSLKSLERDELLSLPADERIDRIRRIMQQQEKQRFEQMVDKVPPEDLDAIYNWVNEFIVKNQERIVSTLPPEVRLRWESIEDVERQRRLLMFAINYRPPHLEGVVPQKEDFDRLLPLLSKQSQEVLKKAPVPGEVLREWVKAAVMSKVMPPATDEQLTEFLKQLPVRERQELEGLAAKEMRERLTRMFYASKFRGGPRPGSFFGSSEYPGRGPNDRGPSGGWRGPDGRSPPDQPPGEDRRPGGPGRPMEGRPGDSRGGERRPAPPMGDIPARKGGPGNFPPAPPSPPPSELVPKD